MRQRFAAVGFHVDIETSVFEEKPQRDDDVRFNDALTYTLRYPDGRHVERLPDGSGPFTIQGYKNFKGCSFNRLRFYICAEGKIHS